MRTAQRLTGAILRQEQAGSEVGRAIQCRGCGELGRALWERAPSDIFQAAPNVMRTSGNFYLHHGQIACGRCQQIYRPD